jgi:hypothetical protein
MADERGQRPATKLFAATGSCCAQRQYACQIVLTRSPVCFGTRAASPVSIASSATARPLSTTPSTWDMITMVKAGQLPCCRRVAWSHTGMTFGMRKMIGVVLEEKLQQGVWSI